jgi:hypothetical protein
MPAAARGLDQTTLMTRTEFVDLVRSDGLPAAQCDAVIEALDRALLEGPADADDPTLWRRRRMNAFLAGQDLVLSLMVDDLAGPALGTAGAEPRVGDLEPMALAHHRLRLVRLGTTHWLARLAQFRAAHEARVRRRDYDDADCGSPPFRDADHGVLELLAADEHSLPDAHGARRAFHEIAPFVDHNASAAQRAALYLDRMGARTLGEADMQSPFERELLGQRGVFARVPLARGTCLGVYGGQLLDEVDQFIVKDDRYLMALRASLPPARLAPSQRSAAVNGEGLPSVMNTRFAYDDEGRAVGHPASGFNVERVLFPARLSHGWHIAIPAAFASTDIAAGEELRFNYELAPG